MSTPVDNIKPLLSVIIATRNSSLTLNDCLASLEKQDYKNYELLVIDAHSNDSTQKIAKKYNAKIYTNFLKTAEAGKAIGLKKSRGKYILLLDSDNMISKTNYLSSSIRLLQNNPSCIGSEPWAFTYRKNAGFIERYSALIGANDPYAWFANKSDKINYLSTKYPHKDLIFKAHPNYLILKLNNYLKIPTIGANGTIFRTDFLKKYQTGNYLFDIDILNIAVKKHPVNFIKLKQGIIHTYCESSVKKFIKKQTRRINDFYLYKTQRSTNWDTKTTSSTNLSFIFYSFSLLLPLATSFYGYSKKPDIAWFFHPFACILTSVIYIKHSFFYAKANS